MYYGMWVFNTFVANSSKLLTTNTVSTTNSYVKVWSAISATGQRSVLVIHKDMNATSSATVTIQLPAGMVLRGTASLTRVTPGAEGVYSNTGISFGGLTFDGTSDGKPTGTRVTESVSASADGTEFVFSVQPVSMALLVLPNA